MTRKATKRRPMLATVGLVMALAATGCEADPYHLEVWQDFKGLSRTVPSDEGLERLRFCESTDRYNITNPDGRFRGAYQFNIRTWDDVAGRWFPWLVGIDPIEVSPHEQDAMARALWSERGAQPWPVCGKKV